MTTAVLRHRPAAHAAPTPFIHASWFVAATLIAFAVPYIFSSRLDWTNDAYYAVYFSTVLLMLGARPPGRTIRYPRSELAAAVDEETDSPRAAYAPYPHWLPGPRPPGPWDG